MNKSEPFQSASVDLEPEIHQCDASNGRDFPRVLIVSKTRINQRDNSGASIGRWFAHWPKDRLAQLYSGGPMDSPSFCGCEYRLTGRERRFGGLFGRLKGSSLGVAAFVPNTDSAAKDKKGPALARFRRRLSSFLVESGLWELVFSPRISSPLSKWLTDFRPDVIYCQTADLTFMRLALRLQCSLTAPMCLHMPDDFPTRLYRRSFLTPLVSPVVHRTFGAVVQAAHTHLAIGDAMMREYRCRYGVRFEALMNCGDPERFRRAIPRRLTDDPVISVVYSGSLAHDRWAGLLDLAQAAQSLRSEGIRIKISVFAPVIPPEVKEALTQCRDLDILPPPTDAEVPSIFKGADILFLPEGFTPEVIEDVRLSISTKAHLYMMAERPILVYGPSEAGTVQYAINDGWAEVVDRRDVDRLRRALLRLIRDSELCSRLVEQGHDVASRNHDAAVVREQMRVVLVRMMNH